MDLEYISSSVFQSFVTLEIVMLEVFLNDRGVGIWQLCAGRFHSHSRLNAWLNTDLLIALVFDLSSCMERRHRRATSIYQTDWLKCFAVAPNIRLNLFDRVRFVRHAPRKQSIISESRHFLAAAVTSLSIRILWIYLLATSEVHRSRIYIGSTGQSGRCPILGSTMFPNSILIESGVFFWDVKYRGLKMDCNSPLTGPFTAMPLMFRQLCLLVIFFAGEF